MAGSAVGEDVTVAVTAGGELVRKPKSNSAYWNQPKLCAAYQVPQIKAMIIAMIISSLGSWLVMEIFSSLFSMSSFILLCSLHVLSSNGSFWLWLFVDFGGVFIFGGEDTFAEAKDGGGEANRDNQSEANDEPQDD